MNNLEVKNGQWYKRKGGKVEWVVEYVNGDEVNVARFDSHDAHRITRTVKMYIFLRDYVVTRSV